MPNPSTNPFILPPIPAELQAIIDADRERFAGWRMMADPPNGADGAGKSDPPKKDDPPEAGKKDDPAKKDDADEALGEAGKKALDAERAQNKELRQQLASVKAFQDGLAKLVNPDGDPKVTPEDAIKQLGEKVEALTHANLVKDIAREFGITEKDDIDLLAELKTEDRIRGLAERLKPADNGEGDDGKKSKRSYRPDPSAGKGGGGGTKTDPREAGRAEAQRRFGKPTIQNNQKD